MGGREFRLPNRPSDLWGWGRVIHDLLVITANRVATLAGKQRRAGYGASDILRFVAETGLFASVTQQPATWDDLGIDRADSQAFSDVSPPDELPNLDPDEPVGEPAISTILIEIGAQ